VLAGWFERLAFWIFSLPLFRLNNFVEIIFQSVWCGSLQECRSRGWGSQRDLAGSHLGGVE